MKLKEEAPSYRIFWRNCTTATIYYPHKHSSKVVFFDKWDYAAGFSNIFAGKFHRDNTVNICLSSFIII